MPQNIADITSALDASKERYSPEGKFLRYASGRLLSIRPRLALYAIGSAILWHFASPFWGILTFFLALGGEALDCGFCFLVPRWLGRGWSLATLKRISIVTALIQSICNGLCIAAAWFAIHTQSAVFFSLAYLSGAAINAGLLLPLDRHSTWARLLTYALTLVLILTFEMMLFADFARSNTLDLLGILMMAFMVYSFTAYVTKSHRKQENARRVILTAGDELKAMHARLEERQVELRNLALVAQHANDSVIITNPSRQITWVNDAFTRITGYSRQEALGQSPQSLLNGPATSRKTSKQIENAIGKGQVVRAEIQNYTKDRQKIWIETNLVPVMDERGKVETVIAVERDITANKTHEKELAKARDEAEQAARAKADFLATMSHEIRTPMNAILGMADLLAEKSLDDEGQLFTSTIQSSATALLRIINDILDMSKLDAGKLQVSNVDFDLPACLNSTIELLKPLALAKGLQLNLQWPKDLPVWVHGDDGRLRQILVNIIGNAIKFTKDGAVWVNVSCTFRGADTMLHIDVKDQGIGISPRDLEHVFTRFSQAQSDTAREFGGTGLGLTISRMLAQEMGGNITASSELGKGSIFSISVRLGAASAQCSKPSQGTEVIRSQLPLGLRVLVAEDNATNRLLVQKYFKGCPIELEFAHDGRQAIEMAQTLVPDVIFMDVSMPEINGLEAARRIRDLGFSDIRIVALTANAHRDDRDACHRAGMDGFLSKPLRKIDLLSTLLAFSANDSRQDWALKIKSS